MVVTFRTTEFDNSVDWTMSGKLISAIQRHLLGTARSLLYLVLGGAQVVPVIAVIAVTIAMTLSPDRITGVAILAACTLPAAVAIALLPVVRRIEELAVRELLGVETPPHPQALGLFGVTVGHLAVGAVYSALVLAIVVPLVAEALASSTPRVNSLAIVRALLALGLLVMTASLVGGVFRFATRRLVATDPRRLARDQERRDAMSRELHDSIGHALSVIAVQTEAARISRPDPALDHIARAASDAQQELDLMLGMLSEQESPNGPDLSDLPRILERLPVTADLDQVDRVPAAISRTAYRIVQEGIANAMRHGAGPIGLRLSVHDELGIEIRNTVGAASSRVSGTGLTGMERRARLVGGTCLAKRDGDQWMLTARMPL